MKVFYVIVVLIIFFNSFAAAFETGSENLLKNIELLEGKRVALITNKSAITSKGIHIIDELLNHEINLVKIFTPEHGFSVNDISNNTYKDIKVISLYDSKKNIEESDLKDIDIIIYDIQDLGARFYTYVSTLYLTMQDAAKINKKYFVCDRPSISNLNYVGGFMLENEFKSFVGTIPVPICYGLTTGELSLYLKDVLNEKNMDLDLSVFKMSDYDRQTKYDDLKIPWVNTSPNITSLLSGLFYPALCFLEGTNISEGRGTDIPFQQFGAPFCNSSLLIEELSKLKIDGIRFEETKFVPDKKISAYNPKFLNQECFGVKIIMADYYSFKPIETAVGIILALKRSTKNFEWVNKNFIDKLAGSDKLRKMINEGYSFEDIIGSWKNDTDEFRKTRNKYILYK